MHTSHSVETTDEAAYSFIDTMEVTAICALQPKVREKEAKRKILGTSYNWLEIMKSLTTASHTPIQNFSLTCQLKIIVLVFSHLCN